MTTKDIRPFLPIGAPAPARSLGTALPRLATPPATSPWSPSPITLPASPAGSAAPSAALSAADLTALVDEAHQRGHAEGLAQTAALRERLAALIDELAAARAAIIPPAAELIAELAACAVEAWTEHTDRGALFAPIVRGWLEQTPSQSASVRVHPDDAAALAAAIGEAPLTIVLDAGLAPGALEFRSATLELSLDWRARVGDLRAAIAAALSGDSP